MGLKLDNGDSLKTSSKAAKDVDYKKVHYEENEEEEGSDHDGGSSTEMPPPPPPTSSPERRSTHRLYADDDASAPSGPTRPRASTFSYLEEDDAVEIEGESLWCCQKRERVVGVKVDTIVRLLKVCLAFPFVIVVSSLNLSDQYAFLR